MKSILCMWIVCVVCICILILLLMCLALLFSFILDQLTAYNENAISIIERCSVEKTQNKMIIILFISTFIIINQCDINLTKIISFEKSIIRNESMIINFLFCFAFSFPNFLCSMEIVFSFFSYNPLSFS